MPPESAAPKRKAAANADDDGGESNASPKKKKTKLAQSNGNGVPSSRSDPLREPHPFSTEGEQNGIILRKYYPHEMSNARAQAYINNEIPRPIEELIAARDETREARRKIEVGDAVVHWYKMDLRTRDNRSLWEASEKAVKAGVPLICIYIVSPQDFDAHLTAPIRVDFTMRTLEILKQDLEALDIPLYVETVEKRKQIPKRIISLVKEWGANHLFTNMEYEVDELRREAKLIRMGLERGVNVEVFHDTCVVPPGALNTGSGKQYAVYSPWYRAWVGHIHNHPEALDTFDRPARNPSSTRNQNRFSSLFGCAIPEIPKNKKLSDDDAERYHALWPAGEQEALDRLEKFCEERIRKYGERRNFPADGATSSISVHLAAGTLSARTAIRAARDKNSTTKLNAGVEGIQTWIGEVAWREFYKHVLVHWPYICMNKPFKPEYSNIEWSYNTSHFQAWQTGHTGFPIVDAAMRQVQGMGWMHNRCRMIVASFLAKDLLLNWRIGERFFMEHLIDGDFASNNGGWGFSASVGVDPQPYFRIFNPLLQSEKFDPEGEYIRKWIPELRDVKGKAIHDPYGRGAGGQAKKSGYPEPMVVHKDCRERALTAYKKGIGRDKP
ncbi:deoxyribodipyrimidine photo-lyase [Xylariaceae sp. FL0255]|nr:deoxyribodipyrimidine photo-lyase [Xylariaceae sp. FL0255]